MKPANSMRCTPHPGVPLNASAFQLGETMCSSGHENVNALLESEFRLHHRGVLVADIRTSSEHYVQRGYRLRTKVIHDPLQTAYVQFLSCDGEQAFLELICPDGAASLLAKVLQRGTGAHHLCYAVPDIIAAGNRLRQLPMLPIRPSQPAVAFEGRQVAWFCGRNDNLIELIQLAMHEDLSSSLAVEQLGG